MHLASHQVAATFTLGHPVLLSIRAHLAHLNHLSQQDHNITHCSSIPKNNALQPQHELVAMPLTSSARWCSSDLGQSTMFTDSSVMQGGDGMPSLMDTAYVGGGAAHSPRYHLTLSVPVAGPTTGAAGFSPRQGSTGPGQSSLLSPRSNAQSAWRQQLSPRSNAHTTGRMLPPSSPGARHAASVGSAMPKTLSSSSSSKQQKGVISLARCTESFKLCHDGSRSSSLARPGAIQWGTAHDQAVVCTAASSYVAISASTDNTLKIFDTKEGHLRVYAVLPLPLSASADCSSIARCRLGLWRDGCRGVLAEADGTGSLWVIDVEGGTPGVELSGRG